MRRISGVTSPGVIIGGYFTLGACTSATFLPVLFLSIGIAKRTSAESEEEDDVGDEGGGRLITTSVVMSRSSLKSSSVSDERSDSEERLMSS